MGKNLTKHQPACILSKEILDEFANENKTLSSLLQKSSLLARLIDDAENQLWIDKEISANFDTSNSDDLKIIISNGRLWTGGNYRLEDIETLETMIDTYKIRLSSAKDPNISYTPTGGLDWYRPHNNSLERNKIEESIRINQSILSKIKGRLYSFVRDTYYVLNFSEITTEIFSSIKKYTEAKLKNFAPEALLELTSAYNAVNSKKKPDWSNVASGCRRILIKMADIVYPPTEKTIQTKNNTTVKLDGEHYRLRINEFLKGKSKEDTLSRDTTKYLFEMLDSLDRLNAKGDKNFITKDTAEKILIYTYLVLFEIIKKIDIAHSKKQKLNNQL